MQINHRFQELSKEDSGKEHVFTWRGDDGAFLFHAMYQSGDDMVQTSDGVSVPRGQVLRLQKQEKTPDSALSLAPGKDKEEHCLALRVFDERWGVADYDALSARIAHEFGEKDERTTAAYAQLASLYNLMATQYGTVFKRDLHSSQAKDIKDVITDKRLSALSSHFEQLVLARMEEHADSAPKLVLDRPVTADPHPAKMRFTHAIIASEGSKNHMFEWKVTDSEELPTPLTALKVKYQSGVWGETVMFRVPLLVTERKREIIIPANVRTFTADSESRPVPAVEQYQRLRFFEKAYMLAPEQQAAALAMLASVYRLAATHYQGEYDTLRVTDAESLGNYIHSSGYSNEADKLERLAAMRMGNRAEAKGPLAREADGAAYIHEIEGEAIEQARKGRISNRDVDEVVGLEHMARLTRLESLHQPTVDITFMDQKDFERAWDSHRQGKIECFASSSPTMTCQRIVRYSNHEDRAKPAL